MSDPREDIMDLMPAVALGVATPEEVARVEAAVAADPELARELASLRSAASVLALEAPPVDPPPGLKDRLMAEVRADAAARASEPQVASPRRARPRRPGWLRTWPALAAATSAAAIALLGWNVALQTGDDPASVTSVAVAGTDAAPGIHGRAIVVQGEDTAVLRLRDLPPLQAGMGYELWRLEPDASPVSGGFLSPTSGDEAVIAVSDLGAATALAVTAEPLDNRKAPTTPIVVQIPLPEQA